LTTPTAAESKISKGEREELRGLLKARARFAKKFIEQRASVLVADIEQKLAVRYKVDATAWKDLTATAKEAVEKADEELSERCRDLGIPEAFRPRISFSWYERGETAIASRRAELRRVAVTRINAMAAQAQVEIEGKALEGQELLAQSALESDAAQRLLASIPSVEFLMPALDVSALGPLALPQPEGTEDGDFE
jgi:hypothetical protein